MKLHEKVVHIKTYVYKCEICFASFSYKKTLTRHKKTFHESVEPTFYTCAMCEKYFVRKDGLSKHISKVHMKDTLLDTSSLKNESDIFPNAPDLKPPIEVDHEKPKCTYKCEECSKIYNHRHSLRRHERIHHGIVERTQGSTIRADPESFECADCGRRFIRKDHMSSHIVAIHLKQGKRFDCSMCGSTFSRNSILLRHVSKIHQNNQTYSRVLNCLLCHYSHNHKRRIMRHYEEVHRLDFDIKKIAFPNLTEFENWKKTMEYSSNMLFRVTSKKKAMNSMKTTYSCHRSGYRVIKTCARKKKFNIIGSKKLDGVCPAKIVLDLRADSTCDVTFFQTHLGHCPSSDEMKYIPLRSEVRRELAGKISSGVPKHEIVDKNLDAVLSHNFIDIQRNDLITCQDISNIQRTFNVKISERFSRPQASDISDVKSFVDAYNECILFYKPPGEKNADLGLNESDVVIVLMPPSLQYLLKKHPDIVCLDGTYSNNEAGFYLLTLIVLDYDGEGHAVAFALSNRNDLGLTTIFLSAVRDTVGVLNTTVLMTDIQDWYYNAWLLVMDPPKFRLFSTWHVLEDWRKNLGEIRNVKKREFMRKMLYNLCSELDENKFREKLEKIINEEDYDLSAFLNYFRREYIDNIECWAFCYKRNALMNVNLYLHTFRPNLKYCYHIDKRMKDLNTTLQIIIEYVKIRMKNLKVKMIRGRFTENVRLLRRAHDQFKNYMETNEIKIIVETDKWLVHSFSDDTAQTYIVDKIRTSCPNVEDSEYGGICNLFCSECGICAHLYRCTCEENSFRNLMCQHIHAIAYLLTRDDGIAEEILCDEGIVNDQTDIIICNSDEILDDDDKCSTIDVDEDPCDIGTKEFLKINPSDIGTNEFLKLKQSVTEEIMQVLDAAKNVDELNMIREMIKPMYPAVLAKQNSEFLIVDRKMM